MPTEEFVGGRDYAFQYDVDDVLAGCDPYGDDFTDEEDDDGMDVELMLQNAIKEQKFDDNLKMEEHIRMSQR